MAREDELSPASTGGHPLLAKALEKSQDVKQKMEMCAVELSAVNETVKKEMISGTAFRHVEKALTQCESVEDKIQECAGELNEVNEALAQEIDGRNKINQELVKTLQKLSPTEQVLSDPENVLAIAHEVVEEAKQRILRDPTTGIPNRQLFDDHLEKAISLAKRCNWLVALMFIDLDRFKQINDTYGHATGDKVLQVVAQRLCEQVRSEDTICRYGGDEFLYLLVNPKSTGNIESIAHKVYDRISQVLTIDDLTLTVEPSIGIAVYPNNGGTRRELVENADAAMYRAKKSKNRLVFFSNVRDHSTEAGVVN
ncbi:MAG: GGDEF domain-containing protein [Nitrosospira sp.]|nr:GGDEF domain-containing protein [Nitrosospira sp.]